MARKYLDTSLGQNSDGSFAEGRPSAGVYHSAQQTFSDGDTAVDQADVNGNKKVAPYLLSTSSTTAQKDDTAYGDAVTSGIASVTSRVWNGTSYDRGRGAFDTGALITASGATTTQTSGDQINVNGRGIKVILNTTVIGTGSITISISGKDAASGQYYTLLTGAAVTTNTTNVYTVYPGLTAVANTTVSDVLPRTFKVTATANNANAATYTVGACILV